MRLAGVREAEKEQAAMDTELNELAWGDVKEYQSCLREERRKSLSLRLAESRRHHAIDLDEHRNLLDLMHAELATKHADWQDVNAYKQAEKESRRKSVSMRLDSWRTQRLAEEKLKAKKLLIQEEEARYREMDWEDLCKAKQSLKEEELENLKLGRMKH